MKFIEIYESNRKKCKIKIKNKKIASYVKCTQINKICTEYYVLILRIKCNTFFHFYCFIHFQRVNSNFLENNICFGNKYKYEKKKKEEKKKRMKKE